MALVQGIICVILAVTFASAQNNPTSCLQSNSLAFDINQAKGVWWEVARNPVPKGNWDCVEVDFIAKANNVVQINTTYSNTPSYLWVNQTMYTSITVDNSSTTGYNISYENGLATTPYTVYKLLATDYNNYAFICGYNATNSSQSFGIVLTRVRYPNTTLLNSYESSASTNYADFTNGTMSLITQSPTCYASTAASLHSLVATLLAVGYALWHITT